MKRCTKCELVKDDTEFRFEKRDNCLRSWCKICSNNHNRLWREQNKTKVKALCIKWKQENRNHVKSYEKKYRSSDINWKARRRERLLDQVENLADTYIKTLFRQYGINNPSYEMIEQKRLQLKLKRIINEKSREVNAQRDNG